MLLPSSLEYVWVDFLELNSARTESMSGPSAISYLEISAWNGLMNKKITANEVGIIKRLDFVFMQHYQKKQAEK